MLKDIHSRSSNGAIDTAVTLRRWLSKVAVLIIVVIRIAIFLVDLLETCLETGKGARQTFTNGVEVTTAFSSSIGRCWIEWQVQSWASWIWVWFAACFVVGKQELLVIT